MVLTVMNNFGTRMVLFMRKNHTCEEKDKGKKMIF